MNEYELLYIITPRKASAEVDTVIEWVGQQVTGAGGEVLRIHNWGRRRLAYPIQHQLEGTYVLEHVRMPPAAAVTLESALHITEDVIRHLLTRGIMDESGSAPPEYVGERPRFAPRPPAEPARLPDEAREEAEPAPAEEGGAEAVPAEAAPGEESPAAPVAAAESGAEAAAGEAPTADAPAEAEPGAEAPALPVAAGEPEPAAGEEPAVERPAGEAAAEPAATDEPEPTPAAE